MRDDLVQILKIATQEALAKRPSEQTKKAHQDYVTDVDLALDAHLNAALTNLTPDVPVLSEEREITALPDRFWMVDPIDGTANLISGIPFVGIAVALIENGETTLAGVADIHHGAIYSAQKSQGAYHNDTRLEPAQAPTELIGVSSGVLSYADIAALRSFGKIRNLGSQALQLCMVASGQLGANLSYEAKLWDDVAGALIAREAGMHYKAHPEGPLADDNQRSICCHPAHINAITDLKLWETTT